jgi:hypothetical protein
MLRVQAESVLLQLSLDILPRTTVFTINRRFHDHPGRILVWNLRNLQDYGVLQPTPEDLCKCLPIEPDIADYRHLAKHVPIPNIAIQEVTVETILGWAQDPLIPPDAPRTGRELEVFHIATGFLQNASVNAADCDVVMSFATENNHNQQNRGPCQTDVLEFSRLITHRCR